MSARFADCKTSIDDDPLLPGGVDIDKLLRLLAEVSGETLDRRGTAARLRFKAFFDAAGRYECHTLLMRTDRGLAAVLHDDLYRAGDAFYLGMNGRIARFHVAHVRAGRRAGDAPSTRILYLQPAHGGRRLQSVDSTGSPARGPGVRP